MHDFQLFHVFCVSKTPLTSIEALTVAIVDHSFHRNNTYLELLQEAPPLEHEHRLRTKNRGHEVTIISSYVAFYIVCVAACQHFEPLIRFPTRHVKAQFNVLLCGQRCLWSTSWQTLPTICTRSHCTTHSCWFRGWWNCSWTACRKSNIEHHDARWCQTWM